MLTTLIIAPLLLCAQEPATFTGSYVHDRFPDATECCLAVAFKGASWTDPDSIPLMVMQTMLGEGGSSQQQQLHTAKTLCAYIP